MPRFHARFYRIDSCAAASSACPAASNSRACHVWNTLEVFNITMKYYEHIGNLWKSMEIYGNLWKSVEIYGNLWKSMVKWVSH